MSHITTWWGKIFLSIWIWSKSKFSKLISFLTVSNNFFRCSSLIPWRNSFSVLRYISYTVYRGMRRALLLRNCLSAVFMPYIGDFRSNTFETNDLILLWKTISASEIKASLNVDKIFSGKINYVTYNMLLSCVKSGSTWCKTKLEYIMHMLHMINYI